MLKYQWFVKKEKKMSKIYILGVLIVSILTFTGLISPAASGAEDKSCWFEASANYDVYFIVREKTVIGEDREYVMWEGWVKKSEKKQYFSKTGQVRYDYRTSNDDGIIGDNVAECSNGNMIRIP